MSEETGGRFKTSRSLRVDDLLTIYDGIIEDADRTLAEEQIAGPLPIPGVPEGAEGYITWHPKYNDPLPPDDLTEVPDLVIGKLFSFFQNWTNYVAGEVTRAKCIKDIQARHLEVIKSALSIYYREEKKMTVAFVGDHVNVDSRFVEVDAALLRIKVFYETANSREAQLRRTLNNISREQTRRANELERLLHDEHGGRGPRLDRDPESKEARRRFGQW